MMKETDRGQFTKMCRMLKLLLRLLQLLLLAEAFFGGLAFFSSPSTTEAWVVLPVRAVNFLSTLIALRFGAAVFRSMERSETPFLYDVSDKIKAASFWLVGGGVVCALYKAVVGLLGYDLFSAELNLTGELTAGMILFALVYVIEQGCRLQKESDETL